jgi:hypothetical protein
MRLNRSLNTKFFSGIHGQEIGGLRDGELGEIREGVGGLWAVYGHLPPPFLGHVLLPPVLGGMQTLTDTWSRSWKQTWEA